jgi:uncharacterized protein YwgA
MNSSNISPFIKFLENKNLLTFDVLGDTEENFLNRLKIQKYAFLAKFYGLDLSYSHSMYKRGPYSPSLAVKYYELAENSKMYEKEAMESLPKSFDATNFTNLVKSRDTNWLEIATTILEQKSRFDNENELVRHVECIKCDYSLDYINKVFKDLKSAKLMS